MGAAASTGSVNNGLTHTHPGYTLRVDQGIQTDPVKPEVIYVPAAGQGGASNQVVSVDAPESHAANAVVSPDDVWIQVNNTLDVPKGQKFNEKNLIQKRSGWKTVRIFVSSTFKDFNSERELLVKEVFPDLRAWCEKRRLHLVECDLRWGVPKDTTTEMTIRMCLGEIDRCYQDNIMPYFLNMTSARVGWIPMKDEVPQNLVDEYRWIFGLSVTEMEIIHGAYRKDNPNSLFMVRDESFVSSVPEKYIKDFVDPNTIAPAKLRLLRSMISDRFPEERIVNYTCEYDGEKAGKVKLKIEEKFSQKIFDFFKSRIERQYPEQKETLDPYAVMQESHQAFLENKAACVLGRKDTLDQIKEVVDGKCGDVPMLILGGPGTGKSSIMAKAAKDTCLRASGHEIKGDGGKGWHVFYHFVGAVPGSTEVLVLLQRLMYELGVEKNKLPGDLEGAVQMSASLLNNPTTKPVIIFIDALNQLDNDQEALLMNWIPRKLGPSVRVICSLIDNTPQHVNLLKRESKPREIHVKPLTLATRKDIIADVLGKFNKKLDMDQMINLLTKESSKNPLWLSIACEELRVFGSFREISDQINSMADGLLELLEQVLTRFETEDEECRHLLVATLCLLEVATRGLLERELLEILADEENLMPKKLDKSAEKGEKEKSEKEKGFKNIGQLPAFKWASVYRSLRTFLRPFGNSGEGRLDFYHRSLSKAVRRKYLKTAGDTPDTLNENYKWWHQKLADYFEQSNNVERRVEEYPHHLIALKDMKRMEEFLDNWDTFYGLFDREHSKRLLHYWHQLPGDKNQALMECYSRKLQEYKDDPECTKELLAGRYIDVARFLVQAGEYDQALGIAEEAEKLYGELESTTDEQKADLQTLYTSIWDLKTKMHEFCSPAQIPEIKKMLECCDAAIGFLRKLAPTDKKHKRELGAYLVKKAFGLGNYVDCRGDASMTVEEATKQGNAAIEEAIKLFDEIQDIGLKAEAVMTKAVLCRYDFNFQIKHYKEALDMCKQAYGDLHVLTGRIYMNTGIAYEDHGHYQKSYENFRQNYEVVSQVFGPYHIRSKRAMGVLNEPMYKRLATQLGHTPPSLEESEQ